jgi:cytochrome c oxidase subunit 2
MDQPLINNPQRILIASGNPLFAKGLEKMVTQRWRGTQLELRTTRTTAETLEIMDFWRPELVIVDYDDVKINRSEFLNYFVSGQQPMQVMLVSLQESGAVVVYDRRTLTPAQADDWLNLSKSSQPERTIQETTRRRSSGMRHYVIAGILIGVVAALVYFLLVSIGILPAQSSAEAIPIDRLFGAHIILIAFLFALITVLMVYSMIVFRARKDDRGDGRHIKGSTKLEVFWTVVPLATVLYFSFLGSQVLAQTQQAEPDALDVNVVGGQWYWQFSYPDYNITSNELYLPVERETLLTMWSVDVIHSFWIPEMRVKQDLLPGENMKRQLRITPTQLGEYQVLCAEMCGLQHAYMYAPVHIVPQEEFDAWINQQLEMAQADPATRGQILAQNSGCLSCHSIDGSEKVGPTWLGLYESERQLVDGRTEVADDEYLHRGIVEPNADIPEGYRPNVMPQNYGETLTEEQINDLVEYIETLK